MAPDAQALIEEARRLQRQRTRRRMMALQVAGVLIVLGFGVSQFTRVGSSTGRAPIRPVGGLIQVPTVTYTKTIVQRFAPGLPVATQMLETWSASNSPLVSRTVVTIPGGPRFETGLNLVHDKVNGLKQAAYLYDPSTQTNWRIPSMPAAPPLEQMFKQLLAASASRHAGTRLYLGRSVYVLRLQTGSGEQTYYIDKRTFEPLVSDDKLGSGIRTVYRTVVYKTLPATKANIALTSLPTAHPRLTTVLQPTQHMRLLCVYTSVEVSSAFRPACV